MANFREKKFRVYVSDGDSTIYITVAMSSSSLTLGEFKNIRSSLKRRIVDALQQLPYFHAQFEDISVKNLKVGA